MSVLRSVTAAVAGGVLLLGSPAHAAPRYTQVATDIAGDGNGVDEFGPTDNTSTGADVAGADLVGLDVASDGRTLTVRVRLSGAPSAAFDYGVQAVDAHGCDVFLQLNGTSRDRRPFVNRVCQGKHAPANLDLSPVLGANDISLRIPYLLLPRGLGSGSRLHDWYFDCVHSAAFDGASYETVSWDHGEGKADYRLR